MKPELKKSKESDINEIAKIYIEEFSKPPYKEQWTLKKALGQVRFYYVNYDLYTIFVGSTVVGFIAVNSRFMCPGEVAFGEEIAIKEEFQNRGIGTFVSKEIFRIYKEKGYKRFIAIANRNSRAMNLYNKLGLYQSNDDVLIEKRLR